MSKNGIIQAFGLKKRTLRSDYAVCLLLVTKLDHHSIWPSLSVIRGWVNNYPQCCCICVSVGSTVIFAHIAESGFLLITAVQVWIC